MKKIFRILCLVIAMALLLSSTSLAAGVVSPPDRYGVLENSRLVENAGKSSQSGVTAQYTYNVGSRFFYDNINTNAKAVQDAILSAPLGTSEFEITLPEPEEWTQIQLDVQAGVYSLFKDHPEVFWYSGGCNYGATNGYYGSGGQVIYTVATLTLELSSAYTDIAATKAALEEAVEKFVALGDTRYEKVKSIHDFISLNAAYDYSFTNPTAHEATSALLEPFLPVCEGYAEAFKIICDKYSIPCVLVTGESVTINDNGQEERGGHMWCYVQMEDLKWYAVDVTWDDQGSSMNRIFTDFLLVGSTTVNTYFGGRTFATEHIPSGQWTLKAGYIFTYPELSSTAYVRPTRFGMALPVGAQKNQSSLELRFIPNEYSAVVGYSGAYYNATATASGKGTGATITLPTGTSNANQTWKIIVRGDVNGDALTNADDLNETLKKSVGMQSSILPDSDYVKAGDINGDGVIDAIDAAYIELYTSGHYDFS